MRRSVRIGLITLAFVACAVAAAIAGPVAVLGVVDMIGRWSR